MLSHHITFKLRKIITLSSTLELILNEVAFPFASECLFLCLRLQVFFFFSFVSVLIFFSTFFFFWLVVFVFSWKRGGWAKAPSLNYLYLFCFSTKDISPNIVLNAAKSVNSHFVFGWCHSRVKVKLILKLSECIYIKTEDPGYMTLFNNGKNVTGNFNSHFLDLQFTFLRQLGTAAISRGSEQPLLQLTWPCSPQEQPL